MGQQIAGDKSRGPSPLFPLLGILCVGVACVGLLALMWWPR